LSALVKHILHIKQCGRLVISCLLLVRVCAAKIEKLWIDQIPWLIY